MNPARPSTTLRPAARWTWLATLCVAALPALAQYKVVGPDGKVTYTDRPPTSSEGKVSPLSGRAAAAAPEVPLPPELTQPVARYPVTLYTATGSCDICASARQLLKSRGVPFAEKQVLSAEDNAALQRLSGGQDVPTVTIGPQTLRGLTPDVWGQYLDAAGYPRDNKLPAAYQYPAPTPITARAPAASASAAGTRGAVVAPAATPAPGPSDGNPTGIKF